MRNSNKCIVQLHCCCFFTICCKKMLLKCGLELFHQNNLCLFIREHGWASVRLMHHRTLLKALVANCFATDRSMAVTPRVLFFVNCLWCLIWNLYYYKRMLYFPLFVLRCVGRLCFLSVAIPDTHFSFFLLLPERKSVCRE
jgi:hypothetical protein